MISFLYRVHSPLRSARRRDIWRGIGSEQENCSSTSWTCIWTGSYRAWRWMSVRHTNGVLRHACAQGNDLPPSRLSMKGRELIESNAGGYVWPGVWIGSGSGRLLSFQNSPKYVSIFRASPSSTIIVFVPEGNWDLPSKHHPSLQISASFVPAENINHLLQSSYILTSRICTAVRFSDRDSRYPIT